MPVMTLANGNTLGYAEYGDPSGFPVLHFHGYPSSRLEWGMIDPDDRAAERGLRVLAIDRPGMGLSPYQPKRQLLDWPRDVEALADALKLERFSVIGSSGGGPYAAACAYAIPQSKLHATAIICGMGPADAPGMKDGLAWQLPGSWFPKRLITLKLFSLGVTKSPERFFQQMLAQTPPPDRGLLERPAVGELVIQMLAEAFRQGIWGVSREIEIYKSPWGFALTEITGRVHLFHGGRDPNVPISVGRHVANAIPNAQATYYGDAGHFSIMESALDAVLDAVSP